MNADSYGDALDCTLKEIAKLREQLADSSNDALRLIETIKYLKGIAERGTGSELPADKTVESFVLEYVKNLESSLRAKDVVIEKLTKRLASTNIIIEVVCAIHPDSACAKYELAENMNALSIPTDSTQILDEVRRAERERCAKVVEEGTALTAFQSKDCYSYAYNRAEAIRAME